MHGWDSSEIISKYNQGASKLLIDSRITPAKPPEIDSQVLVTLTAIERWNIGFII